MKKEDLYILMLKYGKENLSYGFKLEDLIKYLNQNGFKEFTIHTIIFHHLFYKIFFSKEQEKYPDTKSIFFLLPENYLHLLEYQKYIESQKQAKETRIFSIIAIILSFVALLISIFK